MDEQAGEAAGRATGQEPGRHGGIGVAGCEDRRGEPGHGDARQLDRVAQHDTLFLVMGGVATGSRTSGRRGMDPKYFSTIAFVFASSMSPTMARLALLGT